MKFINHKYYFYFTSDNRQKRAKMHISNIYKQIGILKTKIEELELELKRKDEIIEKMPLAKDMHIESLNLYIKKLEGEHEKKHASDAEIIEKLQKELAKNKNGHLLIVKDLEQTFDRKHVSNLELIKML